MTEKQTATQPEDEKKPAVKKISAQKRRKVRKVGLRSDRKRAPDWALIDEVYKDDRAETVKAELCALGAKKDVDVATMFRNGARVRDIEDLLGVHFCWRYELKKESVDEKKHLGYAVHRSLVNGGKAIRSKRDILCTTSAEEVQKQHNAAAELAWAETQDAQQGTGDQYATEDESGALHRPVEIDV